MLMNSSNEGPGLIKKQTTLLFGSKARRGSSTAVNATYHDSSNIQLDDIMEV